MNVKFKILDRLTLKEIDKICYDLDGPDTIILSLNSIWFFNKSILKNIKMFLITIMLIYQPREAQAVILGE